MKDFLSRHSYIIIWILALIIIGSLAILIVQLNGITTGTSARTTATIPALPVSPVTLGSPAALPPSVTLTIIKSVHGSSMFVQWQNLPDNTTELDIFRSKTGASSTWSLWKTISLAPDQLASGDANIDLGSPSLAGYSFYVQAGSGNNPPFWTSSSTVPIVTTSTLPGDGNPVPPPPDNSPVPSPSSSASSSPSTAPPPSPQTPSSSPSSSNPGSGSGGTNSSTSPTTPPGNPYYNPQVQITAYGTAPGSFWVEHVNQSIEIGWQNIPAGVDTITVARSVNSTGPWDTIITQQNPGTTGSYSLQLVDNSLNDPYYYEMTALEGTVTVATYGPVYLAAN